MESLGTKQAGYFFRWRCLFPAAGRVVKGMTKPDPILKIFPVTVAVSDTKTKPFMVLAPWIIAQAPPAFHRPFIVPGACAAHHLISAPRTETHIPPST